MENIYIISDIHGCYKTLLALIEKLPNKEKSKICFVGDLINRGKNSYEVIKLVMENNYDCVFGNHEEMLIKYTPMLECHSEDEDFLFWLNKNGGRETIKSYNNLDEYYKQLEFLKSLPLYIEYKDFKTQDGRHLVVSHSSVGKAWKLRHSSDEKDKESFKQYLTLSRYKNFDNPEIFNVYGHTIYEEPSFTSYRSAIDLGCYQTKDKIDNPRLCALEFPSMKIFTQESLEE